MSGVAPLTLTPNPAVDQLEVGNLPAGTTEYHLLSLTGQQVLSGTLSPGSSQLSLQAVKPGVYLLRLQSEDGTLMPVQRFVKR